MDKIESIKRKIAPLFQRDDKKRARRFHALLALGIIGIGMLVAVLFIMLRRPPRRIEQEPIPPLVKVQQLHAKDIQIVVRGYGTVKPKVEVDILPEVSGKVVSIHSGLKVGGIIRAGEQILQIDPRDYELAVQQAEATVVDAQVRLETEIAEAQVARQEWEELHPDTEPSSPLVLRRPQIRQAEATLESAKAQLATAKLRLERTRLSLPFDALIVSERVDLGQFVSAGQSLGSAYGIGSVEIKVPLEDRELAWFDIFRTSVNGNEAYNRKKTPAKVKANFAGKKHIWQGYVARTTGQVDRTSRMVSVVVEVPEPFDTADDRPPLLPGIFTEVFIQGKVLENALAVPRDAVRQTNSVWVVNDGILHIKYLDIVRADKDFAYAVSGINDEAMIVISSLDNVVDGMKVRTQMDSAETMETKSETK